MNKQKEEDFGKALQSLIYFGATISKILEHPKFLQRLRSFVRRYDFRIFRGERTEDDLFQDICVKLLQPEYAEKLRKADNVPSEEQFFGWLFLVVRSYHVDTIRRWSAQKRDGLRSHLCFDDFDPPAQEVEEKNQVSLRRFLEFIKQYPPARQVAVRLWLKGKSYRSIVEILERLGFPKVTPPTIGNWLTKTIKDYRQKLESEEPRKRSTGT